MQPEPTESSPPLTRWRAAAEVFVCSGYPTQLLLLTLLSAGGISPGSNGALSPTFVFAISAADTVLLLSLVFLFLRRSNERPAHVFFGNREVRQEISLGLLLVPVVFVAVVAVQLGIRLVAPFLRNVEISPFMGLFDNAWLLAGFVALVLIAGGVREELQRAFLLHRFEQRLGGGRLGLLVTSVAFGLGHTVQGWDAGVVTAVLGAFWGALYLIRRSVASTITNHAFFNIAQIALGYATLVRA